MSWTLTGYGRLAWPAVLPLVGSATCAWADYQGFHIGDCPLAPPPYSHLWAWSEDESTMLRVRVDRDSGIVGLLSTHEPPVGGMSTRTVDVHAYTGLPWGSDGQIGQQAAAALQDAITLHEVLLPLPATFVSMKRVSREP